MNSRVQQSMFEGLRRRVSLMVGRAVIRAVTASGGRILLDLDLLSGEPGEGVELAEAWGITSVPLEGAEAVALSVMGTRGHKIALTLGDRRHRPRDLVPGESAMFDDQGQVIAIRRDGIRITTPLGIEVTTSSFLVNGQAVATVTDEVNVTGGSSAGRHPIVTGVGNDG